MKQLSFLDLHYLLQEFKVLEGNRIDSFYLEDDVFYLKVYVSKLGNRYLVNKVSQFIYLDLKKEETSHPNPFISYLRKYLKNAYIKSISQVEGERILVLEIERKQEEEIISYKLYLELFAQGNVILCNASGDIVNALMKRNFKDRSVKVKAKYEFPPKKELSLVHLKETDLFTAFDSSELSLVKFLALKFGLGGKYAEEIVFSLKIGKEVLTKELSKEQRKSVFNELQTLFSRKLSPEYLQDGELIKDFFPFHFSSLSVETKGMESFNDIVRLYFSQFLKGEDKKEQDFEKALQKLDKRLELLKKQEEDVEREYDENRKKGEFIYENYAKLESFLLQINALAKEKGWDEVRKKIKEDPKLHSLVLELKENENEILLEFK